MTKIAAKDQSGISEPPHVAIVLVAAGTGSRTKAEVPKQYMRLGGQSVLAHSIHALRSTLPAAPIQSVIGADQHAAYVEAVADIPGLLPPVTGGATRQESVLRGLEALMQYGGAEFVLVHDAARPFVTQVTIDAVLSALEDGAAMALPGLPVTDTIKHIQDGVASTLIRDTLFAVQTPQGARFEQLLSAHRAASGKALTDDAAVMEEVGYRVTLTAGDPDNSKLTTAEDMKKAEARLTPALDDIRVGQGYDVHRFEVGSTVTLCGVSVPHSASLKGHSDADVGLHALTDAILAALAEGDIGQHFPPSEAKWHGVASDIFLKFAADRVKARGGKIANLAVTLICEAPKIGPHRTAMQNRITDILGLEPGRVAVQATTTEKLGFTGRSEGIAAQALATIRLPGVA